MIGCLTLSLKKRRDNISPAKKPTCGKCGQKHYYDCLNGMDNCFDCVKIGKKVQDCRYLTSQDKESELRRRITFMHFAQRVS